ncbi:MAG: cobyrinate a,c-diamide synthase [Candidatus Sulfobium sp.]|jgi:cobyrinic acid a,c-diamide synthase
MKTSYPRLVIAGLRGGSGKTTVSLGLTAAWRKQGLKVAVYKKGPDYIDAGWLSAAAGLPCYNLDPFLIGREKLITSFRDHFREADCAVIEGNRGLYDGMDPKGTYSTAELAKSLRSPVLLVIDCTKSTRTLAAMVLGAKKFDRRVRVSGVVLNRIAGVRHERVVRRSIEEYCGVPVFGAIPKLRTDFLSERHMGLTPFQEHPEVEKAIAVSADTAFRYLDLTGIWKSAKTAVGLIGGRMTGRDTKPHFPDSPSLPDVTVGIIRDSAFQFYYPENFEELEKRGARLLEISALAERKLPAIDALYIGGGFPETNVVALARNTAFRRAVKEAVEKGLPVYAECGGLMYLGSSLRVDNKSYPMTGIFPVAFGLEKRPQAHGYTVVEISRRNPFYERGIVLKGHEFHYSAVIDYRYTKGVTFSFRMKRGEGLIRGRDGICYKNVLATYTHLHAYGAPQWADGLVQAARRYREEKP